MKGDKTYASQLRGLGYNIPDHIPDRAWVPNGSMKINDYQIKVDQDDSSGIVTGSFNVTFTEPFRWDSVTLKDEY